MPRSCSSSAECFTFVQNFGRKCILTIFSFTVHPAFALPFSSPLAAPGLAVSAHRLCSFLGVGFSCLQSIGTLCLMSFCLFHRLVIFCSDEVALQVLFRLNYFFLCGIKVASHLISSFFLLSLCCSQGLAWPSELLCFFSDLRATVQSYSLFFFIDWLIGSDRRIRLAWRLYFSYRMTVCNWATGMRNIIAVFAILV